MKVRTQKSNLEKATYKTVFTMEERISNKGV
jgi:hypothetical protein